MMTSFNVISPDRYDVNIINLFHFTANLIDSLKISITIVIIKQCKFISCVFLPARLCFSIPRPARR